MRIGNMTVGGMPWSAPRSVMCCYCFESFAPRDIAFRCIKSAGCPPEEDIALAAYQGLPRPPMLPRVVQAKSRGSAMPYSAVCSCRMKTTRAVCPICHNALPSQYGTSESYTIALIGAKEAGKSHYIAVLIHELMNNLGERFNATLNALDDRTRKRYKVEFEGPLYDRKEILPVTRSAIADINVRYPLLYRLRLGRRGWLGKKQRVMTVVFFDTAGEDLESETRMMQVTRYIANSHGLIFLLDPTKISSVQERLGLPAGSSVEDPRDIVSLVAEHIRMERGIAASDRITTPVALAFSKIDEVRHLFAPDSPVVSRDSPHRGMFCLRDAEAVSSEVRAHVNRWMPDFDLTVSQNFQLFTYFGVSALGAPPKDGRIERGVIPRRVEDPFLWLLYRLGVIEGRK